MKKFMFSLLIATFVVLSSSISYAANWQWVNSNDEVGYFFDTETIRYELKFNDAVDTKKITFWEKLVFTQAAVEKMTENMNDQSLKTLSYILSSKTFNLIERSYTTHETIFYDYNGDIMWRSKKEKTDHITPDSFGEDVFIAVSDYARRHHDELIDHTHGD